MGTNVASHFRRLGWRVVSVGRGAGSKSDVGAGSGGDYVSHAWQLPHSELAHLLAVEQPALCVNAAGRASVPASLVEPLADFEASTLLNYNILDDIRRSSPGTSYIHLSSAAVYGNPRLLPVTEHADLAPISPYGWHKHLSELVVEQYARLFGLKAASLRIFSAYGLGLHRQVVWDLVNRALATPDGPLRLQSCAEDSRDFVHGRDVAAAIELVSSRGKLAGEVYNLAGGVETRIDDLAKLILIQLGRSPEIAFDNVRPPGNPSRWHADIGRLKGLGFQPRIELKDGVRDLVQSAVGRSARAEGA